jgi:hypothetical protein
VLVRASYCLSMSMALAVWLFLYKFSLSFCCSLNSKCKAQCWETDRFEKAGIESFVHTHILFLLFATLTSSNNWTTFVSYDSIGFGGENFEIVLVQSLALVHACPLLLSISSADGLSLIHMYMAHTGIGLRWAWACT